MIERGSSFDTSLLAVDPIALVQCETAYGGALSAHVIGLKDRADY